jgi:hypothetical protein
VFVLVFCIFQKQEYIDKITPALGRFKMQFWGHSEVVLHEHDIRKPKNEFTILFDASVRQTFMTELNHLISSTSFTMVASVIDKKKLMIQYSKPDNPYEISLSFGLERVFGTLTILVSPMDKHLLSWKGEAKGRMKTLSYHSGESATELIT